MMDREIFWSSWSELNNDKSLHWLCRAYRNLASDVLVARDPEIEEIGSSDVNCALADMWATISLPDSPKSLSEVNTWFLMESYYFGPEGLYDRPNEYSPEEAQAEAEMEAEQYREAVQRYEEAGTYMGRG